MLAFLAIKVVCSKLLDETKVRIPDDGERLEIKVCGTTDVF